MTTNDRSAGFDADLNALAALGLDAGTIDRLARTGFGPGQFADWLALDENAQIYVLKVLGGVATDDDDARFAERPDSQAIASWMLELPAIKHADDVPELL